jgi:hypothetical protein
MLAGAAFWALAAQVAAQEPSPSPAPTPVPSPSPAPSDAGLQPPAISGYMQVEERIGDDRGRRRPQHEMNIRRARLTASGRVGEHVAYSAMFQGDGANANSASLLEGYVELTLQPWLKARVGQYKYAFDVEGRESDAGTPLVDRPFVTNAVAGALDGSSTASNPAAGFRDRGLTLSAAAGGTVPAAVSLGVFQGAGRASDNNDELAFVLGGSLEPAPGLRVSAGWLSSDNTDRAPDAAVGADTRNTYRAWTLGASAERGRFFSRAEYYRGQRREGETRQDLDGFYAVGSWTAGARVDLVARYHRLRDGRFPGGDDSMEGANLAFKYYLERREGRSGTFVIVDYAFRGADPGVTSGLTLLNDGRGAALESGREVAGVLTLRIQARF